MLFTNYKIMKELIIYNPPYKTISQLVDAYIDYVSNPLNEWRQPSEYLDAEIAGKPIPLQEMALTYKPNPIGELIPIVHNLPKPNREITKIHFMTLLHQLYIRGLSNEQGWFALSTVILQKQYRYYNYMLNTLQFKLILERSGSLCRLISPETFHPQKLINKRVEEDLDRLQHLLAERHQENIETAKSVAQTYLCEDGTKFIERYNANVRKLKIEDKQGLEMFMSTYPFPSTYSKLHYQYIIDKITSKTYKEIESCDFNGRYYHIGTQLPKLLKRFTNIRYSIDCRNSHPLLFNYFILDYYLTINKLNIYSSFNSSNSFIKVYYLISSFLFNNIPYNNFHYFMNILCNLLINNDVESDTVAKVREIKKDVWEYMYRTSHGLLWDDIMIAFPDYDRSQVKQLMFAKVFYSYAKNVKEGNVWAKSFQGKYPTVMKIIRYYKRKFHAECEAHGEYISYFDGSTKDKIQIPHKMMQLESSIFTPVLNALFKKRDMAALGIHDAVVVMNGQMPVEQVQAIMMQEYAKHGLVPTLNVEYYNTNEEYGKN